MAATEIHNVHENNELFIDNDVNSFITKSKYYDLDDFSTIMNNFNTDNDLPVLNINAFPEPNIKSNQTSNVFPNSVYCSWRSSQTYILIYRRSNANII